MATTKGDADSVLWQYIIQIIKLSGTYSNSASSNISTKNMVLCYCCLWHMFQEQNESEELSLISLAAVENIAMNIPAEVPYFISNFHAHKHDSKDLAQQTPYK